MPPMSCFTLYLAGTGISADSDCIYQLILTAWPSSYMWLAPINMHVGDITYCLLGTSIVCRLESIILKYCIPKFFRVIAIIPM